MMIDTACLKWKEECGKRQSCLVYDPYRLSWTIMAVGMRFLENPFKNKLRRIKF